MNIDTDLLSRALQRAGQDELTEEDISEKTSKYRAIKSFYMPTLLLLLSESDWTELKKRQQLTEGPEENLTEYAYAYTLPGDCSRAVSIDDNSAFVIEGTTLYTDVKEPVLLYITNGRRTEVTSLPTEQQEEEVYFNGKHYSWKLTDVSEGITAGYYEDEDQEDYPLYDDISMSPELEECLEYHLASQIALKITGDKNLFNQLLEYAMAIQKRSQKTSREHATGKSAGHRYWGETLGISTEEDDSYAYY